MKSIFNSKDNDEILERIGKLRPDAAPKWGSLTAAQMMYHIQQPVKVFFGELQLKRSIVGVLFGSLAKKTLTKNEPFKQNLPTDKDFLPGSEPDFYVEAKNATELIRRFQLIDPNDVKIEKHPFFGKLTAGEWDALTWKHLDHHLRQFGV